MFVKPKTNPTYAPPKGQSESLEPTRVLLQVYDPALKNVLPPEGREVGTDNDLYWHRRITGGEVEVLSAEDGAKSVAAADAERARQAAEAARLKAAEEKAAAEANKSAGGQKADGDKSK